jgi:hypothetical protein
MGSKTDERAARRRVKDELRKRFVDYSSQFPRDTDLTGELREVHDTELARIMERIERDFPPLPPARA